MRDRDVVVVGGGPAGSIASLLLARAGYDVMLVDRRDFPRPKACGDCLSPGANTLLQRIGVFDRVLAAQPAKLDGWQFSCATGEGFSSTFADVSAAPIEHESLALPRERLDSILLQCAREAGVSVRTGWRVDSMIMDGAEVAGVRVRREDRSTSIGARLTIGADGLRSVVARLLHAHARMPRTHKLSLTAHVRGVKLDHTRGEMHVFDGACMGLAPVENAKNPLFNLTVVLRRGDYYATGKHARLRAALLRFGRRDLAGLITDDVEILASGPFDWPVERIAFPGAALVGDAAGYFDPFTGQGIYHAAAGAEMLSQEAAAALGRSAHPFLNAYAARHRALMIPARRVQRVIDAVCAHPRLTASVFRSFSRAQDAAAMLVGVTADIRPAINLLSPRLIAKFAAASFSMASK